MFGLGSRRGFRQSIVGLVAVVTVLTVATDVADARRHRRPAGAADGQVSRRVSHHAIRDSSYSPPYAAIVVDANSGKTLEEINADSLRHPASLTKIMTLYLLFERLESGKIKLGTMLPISEHASAQAPTKLNLRPGQHVSVEDAIRGIVTRSANDAAVVIAEAIGGDEETFARMMTAKAHALGMSRTSYVNASGLPDDDQVTTARDQSLLGRAIQERFPLYYTYFSTPSFVFRGEEIRNHNHLLGSVRGVDGIKTGYTRASGFNLVTSVRRDNRHIVAVVLGGASAGARDARMRDLIEEHIAEASTRHTVIAIAETAEPAPQHAAAPAHPPAAAAGGNYSLASASSMPAPAPAVAAQAPIALPPKQRMLIGSSEPIRPIAVKTIKVKLAPTHTASLAPAAAMIPVDGTGPAPVPAPVVTSEPAAKLAAPPLAAPTEPSPPYAPPAMPAVQPASAPQPASVAPPAIPPVTPALAFAAPAPAAPAPVQVAKVETSEPTRGLQVQPQLHVQVHKGWIIQIGAYESEDEAQQHLDVAQSKAKALLGRADRFTEMVTKGDKTLYRARFAGLEKAQAEATCRELKRSDMACMTLKN